MTNPKQDVQIAEDLKAAYMLEIGDELASAALTGKRTPTFVRRLIERTSAAEADVLRLREENARLTNPITLTETLTHGRVCSAGYDLDADCVCGLQYRIQLQTEQNLHAAWMKRATEAETENAALRKQVEAYEKPVRDEERPKCECGGIAVFNASGNVTRTCIRCGSIVQRPEGGRE